VEYELWVNGPDDARGRVRIGNDPAPSYRFIGDASSFFSGDQVCVLETVNGSRVSIFFNSSNGTFVCELADEAKAALAAGA
jgi:hypothetical protein